MTYTQTENKAEGSIKMKAATKTDGKDLRVLPLAVLSFDDQINRMIDPKQVKWLTENFDERLVGVIKVSQRMDGSFVILAGQHRVLAMQNLGIHSVTCEVLSELTSEQEEAFIAREDHHHKKRRPLDRLRLDIKIGVKDAIDLQEACDKNGLEVTGGGNRQGELHAIDGARWVAKRGERTQYGNREVNGIDYTAERPGFLLIDDTLNVSVKAWDAQSSGLRSPMLKGIAVFLGEWFGFVDHDKLIEALSHQDPIEIQSQAAQREVKEETVRYAVIADLIQHCYQRYARGSAKLPVPSYK